MQRNALRRIVLGLMVAWVCLSALQTPWNVVDTNHMLYTSDEVLAPTAGRWPFVDYLPQYSNLVGLPLAFIAPLVRIAPVHAAVIVSVALVMLTLWVFLRLLRSTVTPTVQSVWVVAAAAAWPAFSNGFLEGGERAVGALNSGAMRPLLPLALGLGLGRLSQRAGSTPRVVLGIGALAGVAAVNNVDFGVPALLAGATAVIAAAWTQPIDGTRDGATRTVIRLLTWYLVGAVVAIAVTIAVLAVAGGGRPRPMLGALTALTYSRFGWFNVAMPVYGLHTLAALLFLATAGLGVSSLARPGPHGPGRAVAVRAAYFGLLGVLVLPYYAGRSLTPVLVIGYAFIIGVCAAHVFALTSSRLVWIVLVGAGLAAWSFVPQPLQSLARLAGPGRGETHDMVRVVDLDRRAAALRASVTSLPPDLSAGLVAGSGNSLALATGITNAVLTSNAAFMLSGDYWAGLQCEHLAETGLDVVLVEDPAVAAALVGNAECADALDPGSARLLDTGWTAIDLRRGGS
jgi:hypothetical protein